MAIRMLLMCLAVAAAYLLARVGGVTNPFVWPLPVLPGRDTAVWWLPFAGALVLGGLAQAMGVARWRLLLHALGADISWMSLGAVWLRSCLFLPLLPLGWGRDLYRWRATAREVGPEAGAAIAAEKAAALFSLGLLAAITAWPLALQQGLVLAKFRYALVCGSLVGAGLAASLLFLTPSLLPRLTVLVPFASVRHAVWRGAASWPGYCERPGLFAAAVVLSLLKQACLVGMAALVMAALLPASAGLLPGLGQGLLAVLRPLLGPMLRLEASGGLPAAAWVLKHGQVWGPYLWLCGAAWLWILGGVCYVFLPRRAVVRKAAKEQAPLPEAGPIRTNAALALGAGLAGGLAAGALTGAAEAYWIAWRLGTSYEARFLWWGPLAYGLCWPPLGMGMAGLWWYLGAALGRGWRPASHFALGLGGALFVSGVVVGRWRIARDVLYEQALNGQQILGVLAGALFAGVMAAGLSWLLLRRRRLVSIGAAALVLWLAAVTAGLAASRIMARPPSLAAYPGPGPNAEGRPNLLFIVADTLRADYLRLYEENARAHTPALDALAAEAVLYQNALAQAPWTKPSFGTLFTGTPPHAHGASVKSSVLRDDVPSLAGALTAGGYMTHGMANNPHLQPALGFHRGFAGYAYLEPDHYFGGRPSVRNLALYSVLSRLRSKLTGSEVGVTHTYRPAPEVTQRALDWLDESGLDRQPFYLFLHYMDPHDPYVPKGETTSPYTRSKLGPRVDPAQFLEPFKAAYVDEIERLDESMGVLMKGLRERGLFDNTLVVFTADHGEEFFEHGGWWHGFTLYDEVVKVPLLVKYPGGVGGGSASGALARHIDVPTTLLHHAKLPIPGAMEGGVLPIPDVDAGRPGKRAPAYLENALEGHFLWGVRTLEGKLIRNLRQGRLPVPLELYDLRSDPEEQRNLAGEAHALEQELSRAFEAGRPYFGQEWLED